MAHYLMLSQSEWTRSGDPMQALKGIALQAGVSGKDFDACMQDEALMKKIINGKNAASALLNVNSTPTFVFTGGARLAGGSSYKSFKKIIDSLTPDKG